MKFWSPQEDEIILKHYLTHTSKEIAAMLPGRTKGAVDHRIERINLSRARSPQEDEIILKHYLTHTSKEIAAMLPGRTKGAVDHRIQALGLTGRSESSYQRRKSKFDSELSQRLGEPIEAYLKRRYLDEKATYRELCHELNINIRTLMQRMKTYGIAPIDPKTAGRRNYEKHQSIYRKNLTIYKNGDQSRIKTAQTIQENWTKFISEPALNILHELKNLGFAPVPEYAVYRYNIDLAFVEKKLAVEIDGGNWHGTPKKQETDKEKDNFLKSQGWAVLRVGTPTSFPPVSISEAVTIISSSLKS